MTRAGTAALVALALGTTILTGTLGISTAHANPVVCTAADITSQDPGCPPGTGPCTITEMFQVDDGCVLDFGTRTVTISGTLDINSGDVTINAGTLIIAPTGLIDGRGNQTTAPGNQGGMITIQANGAVTVQKGAATKGINVSANASAGTIAINAGGTVSVAGTLSADQLTTAGDGGTIRIETTGDIVSQAGSVISATAGNQSAVGGGEVDLTAGGTIALGDKIDVGGSDGGMLNVCAGAGVATRKVSASGTGDGGMGGIVNITAGTSVQVLDQILAQGNVSSTMSGGGSGGTVTVDAQFGDLNIASSISAEGATPDGAGGEVDLASQGNTIMQSLVTVSARSNGAMGCGGIVCVLANLKFTNAGMLDASGGAGGGEIDLCAGTDMVLSGKGADISGRSAGASGGTTTIQAGANGQGALTISSTVDVTGGICTQASGCGSGGTTTLSACNLTVMAAGSVLAGAPTPGENDLSVNEQLTILGKVNAAKDGKNVLEYPLRKPPTIGTGAVVPTPVTTPRDTCTSFSQRDCLFPCPTCGDGVVEFPETCDNGTAKGCNGCSAFCQLESCDDGLVCTTDSCDPFLGCEHVQIPAAVCTEPPTRTPTQTSTPTPTATRTPTASATQTSTVTVTLTVTATPSDTATSMATTTRTPSPTATGTRTPTPTVTRTLVSSMTPTASPTSSTPGDANCDGRVTAADLSAVVTLTTSSLTSPCGAALDIEATIRAIFNQ